MTKYLKLIITVFLIFLNLQLFSDQNRIPRLPMYSKDSVPRKTRGYRILYLYPEKGFRGILSAKFQFFTDTLKLMGYELTENNLGYDPNKDKRVPLFDKGSKEYNKVRNKILEKLFEKKPELFPIDLRQQWAEDFPDEILDAIYDSLPQIIKDDVYNQMPKRYGGVREVIKELKGAIDYDVYAIFTHGYHPELVKYKKQKVSEAGFSVEFSDIDLSDREDDLEDLEGYIYSGTTPNGDL